MPIQTFNFLNAPLPRTHFYQPDYSQIANFFPDILKSYYQPQELKQDLLQKQQNVLQTKENVRDRIMRNALLEKYGESKEAADLKRVQAEADILATYGPGLKGAELAKMLLENRKEREFGFREAEADIGLTKAQAKHYEEGGRYGLTPGQRALNNMTADQRESYLAPIRPLVPNLSDPDILKLTAAGATLEDFKDMAKENGIDPESVSSIYVATKPNITAQQKRNIVSAGSQVLDDFITESYAPYVSKIGGYSYKQIFDHFKGDNDKLARFYAARMMEEEAALQQVVKSGGNVNMHAVQNMVNKGMGNTRVIPAQMTPEIYKLTKKYVMDTMSRVVGAEQDALSGLSSRNPSGKRHNKESDPLGIF